LKKSFIEKKLFWRAANSEQEHSVFEEKFFSVFLWKNGRVQIEKKFYWKKTFLKSSKFWTRT
jgi:hypothetical protein